MFRAIHGDIWLDSKFRSLSSDGKLVFIYLFSNHHTNVAGLYWLPTEYILVDVGLPIPAAENAIQELIGLGMISRHEGWMFVHGMLKYQSINPSIEKNIQKAFEKCESDVLRKIFFDRQKDKGWAWLKKEDLDSEKGSSDTPSTGCRDKDKDKDMYKDQDTPPLRGGCAARSEADPATPPVPDDNDPVFETAPLNDGTRFEIRHSHVDRLSGLYPMVDVVSEIRSAVAWSEANPKHRKTRGGYMRHLNQWLAKEQNKNRTTVTPICGSGTGGNGAGGETRGQRFDRKVHQALFGTNGEGEVIEHG